MSAPTPEPPASPERADATFAVALPAQEAGLRSWLRRAGVPSGELDDVVQEAFARAWRSRHRFDPQRPLGPWLRTTALRSWLDLRRAPAPGIAPAGDTDPGELADPRRHRPDVGLQYADALAALPDNEAEILDRFHRRGESIRDLARHLDLPAGTVKSHLHRARRRLAAGELHPEDPA